MSALNLLYLLPGDSQNTNTDKINFNFDLLLSMGGGPIGLTGNTGPIGPIGPQGATGLNGLVGLNGTVWTTGAGIPSAVANANDLYLDTSTGDIYTYSGVSWSLTGTLTSTGLFKSATTSTSGGYDLIISSPGAGVSLVLSELDYNAPPVGPAFEPSQSSELLKIVARIYSPDLIRFSSQLDASTEMSPALNATVKLQPITSNTEYRFELDNPSGDIRISAKNNFLTLGQTGDYDFVNLGASAKLKFELSSAAERHIAFSTASAGTNKLHFGLQGYTTASNKLFTIVDNGKIGINNPAPLYQMDKAMPTLALSSGSINNWDRFTANVQNGVDQLVTRHIRNFTAVANSDSWKSSDIKISKYSDIASVTTETHFISFAGGAKASSDISILKPQLRLGYGTASAFSLTKEGSLMLATDATIKDIGTGSFPIILPSKLHIQYTSTTALAGTNSHAGIHLHTGGTDGNFVGITASGSNNGSNRQYQTAAGLLFETQAPAGPFAGGVAAHVMTSHYGVPGQKKRYTFEAEGNTKHWSQDNANHFLETNVSTGAARIASYENGFGWRNLILNYETTITNATVSTPGSYTGFIGIGPVDPPQTKLQVWGAVTIGNRSVIPTIAGTAAYNTYVGLNSFTVGQAHKNAGQNSVILSGDGHTISSAAINSVIIGDNGIDNITLVDPNKIVLGTQTFLGWTAPSFNTNNTEGISIIDFFGTTVGNTKNLMKAFIPFYNDITNGYNGIEFETEYNENNNNGFLFSNPPSSNVLLLTKKYINSSFVTSYPTQFRIDSNGNLGVGTNFFTKIEAASPTFWVDSTVNALKMSIDGDQLFKSRSTGAPVSISNAIKIMSTNSTLSSSSNINKYGLCIKVGLNKNIGSGIATGGNLYLSAGDVNSTNVGTQSKGGNVYISGGDATGGNPVDGNVIIANNGTSNIGKVGIRTTTPLSDLDVHGEVQMLGASISPPLNNNHVNGTTVNTGTNVLINLCNYDRIIYAFTNVSAYSQVTGDVDLTFSIEYMAPLASNTVNVGHWHMGWGDTTSGVAVRNRESARSSTFYLPANCRLKVFRTGASGGNITLDLTETKMGK